MHMGKIITDSKRAGIQTKISHSSWQRCLNFAEAWKFKIQSKKNKKIKLQWELKIITVSFTFRKVNHCNRGIWNLFNTTSICVQSEKLENLESGMEEDCWKFECQTSGIVRCILVLSWPNCRWTDITEGEKRTVTEDKKNPYPKDLSILHN